MREAAAHGVARGDTLTVDIHALAGGTGKGAGAGVAKVDGLAAQWVPLLRRHVRQGEDGAPQRRRYNLITKCWRNISVLLAITSSTWPPRP